MLDAFAQVFSNLRANKLRSCLTMFGILWGVISVVVLSATGEGFRRGNQHVLEELGKNVAVVWGDRTTTQAGGARAGRRIFLTASDARALEREAPLVAVVSAEIQKSGVQVKSAYNAAAITVDGIESSYQDIRTIEVVAGRRLTFTDDQNARRVALVGADSAAQLFGEGSPLGETIRLNGVPYTVVGQLRPKDQDSTYNGRDNEKVFVPFSSMARDFPRTDAPAGAVSQIVVAPHQWVVDNLSSALDNRTARIGDIDWPLQRDVRHVLARRHRFDPEDRDALRVFDTSLESLLFSRMVQGMRKFFTVVSIVTLALGGLGVMNIMLVAVRERTREIGLRRALGATVAQIQRQFFLEGFIITVVSGAAGFLAALVLCAAVNTLPMPQRFQGMILTWEAGTAAIVALVIVGVVTSVYPARRAAQLTPVEALRSET